MFSNIGDDFQKQTKYHRGQKWTPLNWLQKPEVYKNYPSRDKISLSFTFPNKAIPFTDLLKRRKSVRTYSPRPISRSDLSFLLWASTGVQRKEQGYEFRTVPSAGALYPIETYIVVNNVEALEKGIYHYDIAGHALDELRLGAFGERLAHGALDQMMCLDAPATFIWAAIFERSKWKYKQRAYRYVYLDAGHIAQNLALAATSIGLGSCQIGAIFDDEVNGVIGLDGVKESAIYLGVVGHPYE
jgi:SagB-type dehydrogenase family enzyme